MGVGLDSVVSSDTVLFALVIWAVTMTVRRVVECLLRRKRLDNSYYWRELALPLLPVAIGAILALVATGMPYPAGWSGRGAHVLYGVFCGFFAGTIYRVANSILREKWSGALPPSNGQ